MGQAVDEVLRLGFIECAVPGVRAAIAAADWSSVVVEDISAIHLGVVTQIKVKAADGVVSVLVGSAAGIDGNGDVDLLQDGEGVTEDSAGQSFEGGAILGESTADGSGSAADLAQCQDLSCRGCRDGPELFEEGPRVLV